MNGKGVAISAPQGRAQPTLRAAATATQATTAKPAEQRPTAQVSLLRLTALRLLYQGIRMVEDVELCEAGLSG